MRFQYVVYVTLEDHSSPMAGTDTLDGAQTIARMFNIFFPTAIVDKDTGSWSYRDKGKAKRKGE